jgi:dTDP-4-amino-4,6-dideoxygalactose transaminase
VAEAKRIPKPVRLSVPLLDLKPQYQALKAELDRAMLDVAASQMFILGAAVRELEARVAEYCGARHGIGISSGTDALLVALMALDVGPGDVVVTTPYTFFATGGTVARLGARPVYVDIDPASFNLRPELVREYLAKRCERRADGVFDKASRGRVRAIMPVHLYGQLADMDALLEIAREFALPVVEDAAQAIGAERPQGRRAGGIGDVGCLSFFPTKNLGAFGDAGMCVTSDDALAAKLRVLRVHGGERKYFHAVIGGNFRLDEIQAAVLLVKLPHLEDWHRARQRNASYYDAAFRAAGLAARVVTPTARPECRHIYNQYVIRVPDRDRLRAYLAECGVGTEIYYPVPLHMQECFAYLGYRPEDCPEAERASNETLALPIYPELSERQLRHVVNSISTFYGT